MLFAPHTPAQVASPSSAAEGYHLYCNLDRDDWWQIMRIENVNDFDYDHDHDYDK